MKHTASAPGKIILTGEYAVTCGYPGIAAPASCSITAVYDEHLGMPDATIVWDNAEHMWQEYAEKILHMCKEENDQIFGKIFIQNTIPLGKGMGSSTALIIAICRAVLGPNCERIARKIEDACSPGHSGIDFATIWQQQPIEFRAQEEPRCLRLEYDILEGATLIDTGVPGEQTAELVAWVQSRQEELQGALAIIGNCTERIIRGKDVRSVIRDHHQAQVMLGVVPSEVQELIKKIEQDGGAAKVIGAGGRTGGAGMVIAFTNAN